MGHEGEGGIEEGGCQVCLEMGLVCEAVCQTGTLAAGILNFVARYLKHWVKYEHAALTGIPGCVQLVCSRQTPLPPTGSLQQAMLRVSSTSCFVNKLFCHPPGVPTHLVVCCWFVHVKAHQPAGLPCLIVPLPVHAVGKHILLGHTQVLGDRQRQLPGIVENPLRCGGGGVRGRSRGRSRSRGRGNIRGNIRH